MRHESGMTDIVSYKQEQNFRTARLRKGVFMIYHLQCGADKADITPPLGTILFGYAPGRPAQSVGDGLEAVAILLKSDTGNSLLVTCTIAILTRKLSAELCKIAGEACGIAPENVTICCTHTHSGPNTHIPSGWGDVDNEYIENILKPGVREAAKKAADNLVNAQMGVGEVDSDIGMNRRQLKENGEITLGQNPWGIRDPKLTVVSFKGEDGQIVANLIHYGCHGTASGNNPEITRDWAGVMTDMLEAETGAITGFYNGYEGDQGPNLPNGKTTGNYKMALQLGARAGNDAVRAWRSIREYRDVPVKVLHETIRIPYEPLATREEAERKLEELGSLEQIYAKQQFAKINEYNHWHSVLAIHDGKAPTQTHFTYDQNITTIGPVAIVPSPFEAFAEIGLRIRAHSPYPYTLNLSNCHGGYAYLPTKNDIPSGGYELWYFLYAIYTTYHLPKNTDDHWVMQNLALLRKGQSRE